MSAAVAKADSTGQPNAEMHQNIRRQRSPSPYRLGGYVNLYDPRQLLADFADDLFLARPRFAAYGSDDFQYKYIRPFVSETKKTEPLQENSRLKPDLHVSSSSSSSAGESMYDIDSDPDSDSDESDGELLMRTIKKLPPEAETDSDVEEKILENALECQLLSSDDTSDDEESFRREEKFYKDLEEYVKIKEKKIKLRRLLEKQEKARKQREKASYEKRLATLLGKTMQPTKKKGANWWRTAQLSTKKRQSADCILRATKKKGTIGVPFVTMKRGAVGVPLVIKKKCIGMPRAAKCIIGIQLVTKKRRALNVLMAAKKRNTVRVQLAQKKKCSSRTNTTKCQ